MSDARTALDQWIAAEYEATDPSLSPWPEDPDGGALRLATALRNVLDFHQPRDSAWGRQQCDHCADLCHSGSGLGCDEPDAPWPCDTVRAITSALGDTTP